MSKASLLSIKLLVPITKTQPRANVHIIVVVLVLGVELCNLCLSDGTDQ